LRLPESIGKKRRLGFFPGSTIGNFEHGDAVAFLQHAGNLLGEDAALLLGVDLKKDQSILIPAYDDSEGITAAFNLNLLERINRELDGSFNTAKFAHEAIYNEDAGRVEIYLTSREDQEVRVLGRSFHFVRGERIHTENSHKYTTADVAEMARRSGWTLAHAWVDDPALFCVAYLVR